MKLRILILAGALALSSNLVTYARTKVACIGNSITYGMTLSDREHTSYPARLQQMLGPEYEVGNFGRNGATLLRKGHNPWNKTPEAAAAFAFAPDIAVIHLGTNDTDPRNWPNHGSEFSDDYLWLIDTLRTINPSVRVIIANMAPIGTAHRRFKSGTRLWRDLIRERIAGVAQTAGVELIDFAEPLIDHPELLPDNLHPTHKGAMLLADYVRQAITGQRDGLSLPEIYSDGMVLPHSRYLTIAGNADSNADITLTIRSATYRTKASNLGHWEITIDPLPAGGPYSMSVTDGRRHLNISDIMAGEVWLASGQSNMEFRLREAVDSPSDPASNPKLRVFRMSDRMRPSSCQWPDSILERVDNLDYYLPGRWSAPDSEFSAVAWHFANMLADSLGVTVGVISNPVGGAGIESFIDMETMRHGLPEALLEWQTNDYVQPWVQGRAAENTGGRDSGHRHPYEPTYLFSAGIRPLGHYPLSGVIWYQGESNAHNIEVHEALFPLLIDSWRREFRNPQLPFVMAQLSGIERPSWPEFRDSQRRLADSTEGVWMAVTHDVGDPYDVHPRQKAPVGKRMARAALNGVYGLKHITPSGPTLRRAESWPDGTLRLIMDNATGMTTSDSSEPRTFEIAAIDGIYRPANVKLQSDTIILSNPEMKKPRFARYGWQPFTTANLVNSDSLPASTFRAEAIEVEPGMECGVSAAFGGTIGSTPVIAGGCNFPYADPLAQGIAKIYYKGIYRASDGVRIGSLPQATAYGASAATPLGLALIGGEGIRNCYLLTLDADGNAVINDLPELPVAVDNAYAAAVGSKVYLAGGNADGVPSNSLYVIDVANPADGWRRLADMPGNPRVQPVMAAGPDGTLYLWGGFAPRHEGHEPTLQCDGLRYHPESDSWTLLAAPTIGRSKICLGGGVAACIDGKIVCTGGVNREVFLNALRKQPDDYLLHPVEWYRFNGYLCVYDTATDRWTIGDRAADYARAGAACAVTDGGHTLLLMGGEIKPRIRTPRFTPIKF